MSEAADVLRQNDGVALCEALNALLQHAVDSRVKRLHVNELLHRKPGGKTCVVRASALGAAPNMVVLKFVDVRDEPGAEPGASLKRFQREVAMVRSCTHENIYVCYSEKPSGVVPGDDTLVFAQFEYLPGGTLDAAVDTAVRGSSTAERESGAAGLDEKRVLRMAVDVLHGLECIHAHGQVHKDIKCENIVRLSPPSSSDSSPSSRESWKIVDFGESAIIKTRRHEFSRTMLTQSRAHNATGTMYYMSPEQHEGDPTNHPVGGPSDLWSLGVVMFRSLSGRFPHGQGGDILSERAFYREFDRMLHAELPRPSPTCSDALWRVVKKALQPCANDRYASAKAMLEDLEPLLKSEPLPPGCEYHFFICKNEAKGAPSAMNVTHSLTDRGYKVWNSNNTESPNQAKMEEGVRKSAVVILFLTNGIFSRRWCRDVEIFEAVKRKKPFLLIRQKKGLFEFNMTDDMKAEIAVAIPEFQPIASRLLRQHEIIDWSLNITIRPALINRFVKLYLGRKRLVADFYNDEEWDEAWVADWENKTKALREECEGQRSSSSPSSPSSSSSSASLSSENRVLEPTRIDDDLHDGGRELARRQLKRKREEDREAAAQVAAAAAAQRQQHVARLARAQAAEVSARRAIASQLQQYRQPVRYSQQLPPVTNARSFHRPAQQFNPFSLPSTNPFSGGSGFGRQFTNFVQNTMH